MRPRERRETGEQDMFRSRLDQVIEGTPTVLMKDGHVRRKELSRAHVSLEDVA